MRVFTTGFLRLAVLVGLMGVAGTRQAWADEALRHVQQSLRDQGFYYGPIDGSPGDETTQALRRYQIRNGLAVTGQLNDETRRSIEKTGSSSHASSGNTRSQGNDADSSTPPPLSTPSRRVAPSYSTPVPAPAYRPPPNQPPPDQDTQEDTEPAPRAPGNIRPDLRVDPRDSSAGGGYIPPNGNGGGYAPPNGGGYAPPGVPPNGIAPSAPLSTLLASTPYEFAPPPVQADVLRRAQFFLARGGFYNGRANGAPGPATTEALVNFQEVNRLRRTGRLDVNTLAVMRLLPGRQTLGPRGYPDPRQGPNIIFQGRIVD